MTVTIQQEKIGNYYISIEQDKYSVVYKVNLSKSIGMYNFSELYHTVNEHMYSTLQKAKARYNYLKRKIQKGDI